VVRRQHVLVRPLLHAGSCVRSPRRGGAARGRCGCPPSPYTYTVHVAPQNRGSTASHSAYENAVEPSIGADWTSGLTAFQADLGTYFVAFDDRSRPARATWTERSPVTSAETLDPILYTDNQGTPAAPLGTRTIVSQLAGTTSLSSTTDDAGLTYLPDSSGQTSGVGHQTVGGGPYAAFPPTGTAGLYPSSGPKRAIYYCSQDVATAFCERSDNGGTTFGPPVPIYTVSPGVATGCQGLHGHVRVRPGGVVLVPNKNCGTDVGSLPGSTVNRQAVAENTDNNTTAAGWSNDVVPDSTAGVTDPSTTADASNTMYFGYGDGVGDAKIAVKRAGSGWSSSVDVGALVGVEQTAFPDVIAGSAGRAAFAFLGSTTPTTMGIRGVDRGFAGVWEAYIARTVDSGVTWSVQKVTTDSAFPVQKGAASNWAAAAPTAISTISPTSRWTGWDGWSTASPTAASSRPTAAPRAAGTARAPPVTPPATTRTSGPSPARSAGQACSRSRTPPCPRPATPRPRLHRQCRKHRRRRC